MKALLPYLILLGISFSSCKKNSEVPAPDASFTFRGVDATEFKLGTDDTITLSSQAHNNDVLNWDLGNGTSSTKNSVLISYPNSGTYNVTLTIKNSEGKQATVTKKITVLDRVLKSIIVKSVYWDPIPQNIDHYNYVWPQTTTADIFVQFQQYTPGDPVTPFSGLYPNSPVLLSSQTVHGIANKTTSAFELPFSGRFVLNKKMVENRTLLMSLMAKDASGQVYNLMSNLASGSNWLINDDIAHNSFTIKCGLLSAVELTAVYE